MPAVNEAARGPGGKCTPERKGNLRENAVSQRARRETELVALGAALGSNCIPCIEHQVAQARKAGLTDAEIDAAIRQAGRCLPARCCKGR